MEDAEWFVAQGAIECARAVYCVALKAFPAKKGIWTRAALLEKEYGTTKTFVFLLLIS
jgi:pre-mRNA-processing factor 6